MRRILVVFVTAGLLEAQFSHLVAPGSGVNLYFSTDKVLRGSGDPPQGRIFKVGAEPLALVFTVDYQSPPSPPPGQPPSSSAFSNYYNLKLPDASRDGSLISYVAGRDCRNPAGNPACLYRTDYFQTSLPRVDEPPAFVGDGRLSGNGRYLLLAVPGTLGDGRVALEDLETGAQTAFPVSHGTFGVSFDMEGTGRLVADDGTALFIVRFGFNVASGLYIIRNGQADKIGVGFPVVGSAAIDASATAVLYAVNPQSGTGPHTVIRIYRLDQNQDDLFVDASGGCNQPSLTADGQTAAFVCAATPGTTDSAGPYQLYTAGLDGTGLRAVTADPDGVVTYALSDDGSRVWYASGRGSLNEVDLLIGQAIERIPPTPQIFATSTSPALVAGSIVTLTGIGLTEDTRVTVAGIEAPIISIASISSNPYVYPYRTKYEEITLQVPSGIEINDGKVVVRIENCSPLEEDASLSATY